MDHMHLCDRCGRAAGALNTTKCVLCKNDIVAPHDAVVVAPLPNDHTRAVALRQWFLSKWYGHGGVAVRAEAVLVLYNPSLATGYLRNQQMVASRGSYEGQQPILNERRLFHPDFPALTCKFWAPDQNGAVLCDPLKQCNLCRVVQHGPPSKLGADGSAVGLVHEPLMPASASSDHMKPLDVAGGGWKTPKRHVCFVCHATLGNMSWTNDATRIRREACNARGALVDSWLLESSRDEQSVVAVVQGSALPTYAIVFSIASPQ